MTSFRGAAVSIIYVKLLSLHEGDYEDSSAVTLMSTDVDRIAACLIDLYESWARVLEVGIGIYLLARQMGWVCVMPLITVGCEYLSRAA